jgi:hypothetical protein
MRFYIEDENTSKTLLFSALQLAAEKHREDMPPPGAQYLRRCLIHIIPLAGPTSGHVTLRQLGAGRAAVAQQHIFTAQ